MPDSPANPWLRRLLIVNLVAEVGIVVTGGLVRLTGSGLGCPTWPRCTADSFVPVAGQEEGFRKFIEFGNRTLTGVVSIAALLVIVAIWKLAPERAALKRLAFLPLIGVGLQAVVGGITVLTGLSPTTVALHFLASMVLIWLSTYLLYRVTQEGDEPPTSDVHPAIRSVAYAVSAVLAVVLALGTVVTGSGPHSGDADTPRFGFDPRSVSWLHADAVMLFVGLVVAVLVATHATGASERVRRAWLVVLGLTLFQGGLGYLQYFTGIPWLLVLVHMLAASLLVVAVTWAVLTLRSRDLVTA
ncbi:cytochrome c oxidase assembly protein subunit 15 [Barrientosiimonas humi]|uniref:Cytochrome c oxidase assembly protein subunit 15 n=1 Tax=Barrientosiimonas humi TaxID=999931 RepID=A0A542XBQ4_9MICO|nr:COX15/CtaA family protein [Barrientosiimonas humi]TQL33268.1 cytochrome c oxidase assembly protein subunit 15 [Barrientosiimonas humi]CAG7573257.1 Heme A synthase [Barrientosiimonas humi]